ncbi:MAG: winged helix-turn-helix transcriptional regulator [Acidobacteria bacterium]|nr:winged helix-turn-helix transcriptional regulator [Acidobacteriota bacterium]
MTNDSFASTLGIVLANNVALIQACFPEIYFACHTRHADPGENCGLTPRDGTLLAHIAGLDGIEPAGLARHLGRAKSTLSPALKKLESLGFIELRRPHNDGRRRLLRITPAGRDCVSRTSVLETDRLSTILSTLTMADQHAAVQGLQLLAAACRRVSNNGVE